MEKLLVLIVNADRAAARAIEAILLKPPYRTSLAACAVEAISLMERKLPHVILCEIDLPAAEGLALLKEVRARWPLVPFILVTATRDIAELVRAFRVRIVTCLLKPITPPEILRAVEEVVGPSPQATRKLVGESRAMARVFSMIGVASRSSRNVLITGETGTGKQLVAEAVHDGSERGERRLVEINCGAIPGELFEAEVFGRKKGAYTGAEADQMGLLDRADGSSVFLDEVEAMKLEHQAKILKVMEDGRLRSVGTPDDRRISVRYLAAMNEDPRRLIVAGRLRKDLYNRLNEIRIDLPPLRDRTEDITLLAAHFLGDASAALTDEVLTMLKAYDWPGNVRELKKVVLGAMEVALDRHAGKILREHVAMCEPAILEASLGFKPRFGSRSLKDHERDMILNALRARRGNKSAAARDLGMPRATFLRKLLKCAGGKESDDVVSN